MPSQGKMPRGRRSRRSFWHPLPPSDPEVFDEDQNVARRKYRGTIPPLPPDVILNGYVRRGWFFTDPVPTVIQKLNNIVVSPPLPPTSIFEGRSWRSIAQPNPSVQFDQYTSGLYRLADTSLELYELYVGEDADPDLTAAADATSATLPFTHAFAAAGAGLIVDYRWTVLQRNKYNLVSLNQYYRTTRIDENGAEVLEKPSAPENTRLTSQGGGTIKVQSEYRQRLDADRADLWAVYVTTTGVDPDPGVDVATEYTMGTIPILELLNQDLGPYSDADDLRVLVRTRRDSDDLESTNTTAVQLTVDAVGPTLENGQIILGSGWGAR